MSTIKRTSGSPSSGTAIGLRSPEDVICTFHHEPKDSARGVVLGAVLNLAMPTASNNVGAEAVVLGSEPVMVEAFTRVLDWLMGDSLSVSAEPMGGWWKIQVTATGERKPLPVPELGEPLVRLVVDTQLDGWLDASRPDGADIYLPAYSPR